MTVTEHSTEKTASHGGGRLRRGVYVAPFDELADRRVDELRLWVMPVVVGTGQRLFEDVDASSVELTLTNVRKLANSSVVLTYVLGW